jgi:glycosyltransferase involved in cell wall biosynthesis
MIKKVGTVLPYSSSDVLHVIAVISNPYRYSSRYRLYNNFKEHMSTFKGIELWTVECAFGDRAFEVTKADDPHNIQLRSNDEVWLKEPMQNVALGRLPSNWNYVATVDADIQFLHPFWVEETLNTLQHHPVIQLFETATNLGPTGGAMDIYKSFGYQYVHNAIPNNIESASIDYYGKSNFPHPGYANAYTKEAIDGLGGFIDGAILGSADFHQMMGLIGRANESYHGGVTQEYKDMVLEWQGRALTHIRKNIGYVNGGIIHHYHGNFKNRKYRERWQILVEGRYNPLKDIKKNYYGMPQLTYTGNRLRKELQQYFRERNEDGE